MIFQNPIVHLVKNKKDLHNKDVWPNDVFIYMNNPDWIYYQTSDDKTISYSVFQLSRAGKKSKNKCSK